MSKLKKTLCYTSILFSIETFLQMLYYSVRIKYFSTYSDFENLYAIFMDSFYVIGVVKILFFLPIYLLLFLIYFSFKSQLPNIPVCLIHSLCFLLVFVVVSTLLPGDAWNRLVDTLLITLIAFISAMIASRILFTIITALKINIDLNSRVNEMPKK